MADRKLTVVLAGDTSNLKGSLDEAEGKLGKFGSAAGKAGLAIAGAGVAVGGAAVAFGVAGVKSFLETGDAIQKMALRTGFSTEELSKLKFAAGLSGSSIENLEKGVKRMQSTVYDASQGIGASVDALDALGLSAADLQGLSPEDQFSMIAAALADVEDAGTKAALAQDIFGKAGTEMLPMLAEGSEGLAKMKQEAEDLGQVFSQDMADDAADLNDNIDRLKARFSAFQMEIAAKVVPALNDLAVWLGPKVTAAIDQIKVGWAWFQEHGIPVIEAFAVKVQEKFAEFQLYYSRDIKPALDNIQKAVEETVAFVIEHWEQFDAVVGPILDQFMATAELVFGTVKELLQIVIDLLGGDFSGAWENTKQLVSGVLDFWKTSLQNTVNFIRGLAGVLREAGTHIIERLWDGIKSVWDRDVKPFFSNLPTTIKNLLGDLTSVLYQKGKDLVQGIINGITSAPGAIKDAIAGLIPGSIGLPGVGSIGIPGFAEGGVVPGPIGAPQLAVVHGGEEVLTPSQRGRGGNQTIVLQVDGRELARVVVDQLGREMV